MDSRAESRLDFSLNMISSVRQTGLLALLSGLLVFPGGSPAQTPVVQFQDQPVAFTLEEQPEGGQRKWKCFVRSGASPEIAVFALKDPDRIVIDLPSVQFSRRFRFEVQSAAVARVRTGNHPGKARIVLDLGTGQPVNYTWVNSPQTANIELTLGPTASANTTTARAERTPPPAALLLARRAGPAEEPQPIASPPVPSPTAPPLTTTAPVVDPQLRLPEMEAATRVEAADPSQLLKAIEFEYNKAENTPVVKLLLAFAPDFTLVKRSDTSYELSVSKCAVSGAHLLLPYFPPFDFEGINVLKAEQSGEATIIAVTVDRGVKLAATPNGSEIWLTRK
jgi:hypothetical protein